MGFWDSVRSIRENLIREEPSKIEESYMTLHYHWNDNPFEASIFNIPLSKEKELMALLDKARTGDPKVIRTIRTEWAQYAEQW